MQTQKSQVVHPTWDEAQTKAKRLGWANGILDPDTVGNWVNQPGEKVRFVPGSPLGKRPFSVRENRG